MQDYDIVIVGGGINGCGLARDAAGRGLSVLLAEKGDLASATSSASTKLVHGGLRYLEQLDLPLVRESLKEREVLLRIAPHLVAPLRFVLPHHRGLRPALLIRLGLLLYDHLGGRQSLPRSAQVDLSTAVVGRPLQARFRRGFEYSDCRVDDSRLVVLNAVDAAARSARIRPRTEVMAAARADGRWQVDLRDAVSGRGERVRARTLVNASGAWVAATAALCAATPAPELRLVQGSHIVVRRLFDHDCAYLFQNADRRIVFAIPYERDFTLIGTTDVDFAGDPAQVAVSDREIAYLCAAVNAYFKAPVAASDVVWSYAGARALHDGGGGSPQDAARDYRLDVDGGAGTPALLSVVGGKITTYRRVAEAVLQRLAPQLPHAGPPWTHGVPLPGGDFGGRSREALARDLAASCPPLSPAVAARLAASYGTLASAMLAGVGRAEDLGTHFGSGLYEREVAHLVANEWARTADDILWRRSKLGLRFGDSERRRLGDWLAQRAPCASSSVS